MTISLTLAPKPRQRNSVPEAGFQEHAILSRVELEGSKLPWEQSPEMARPFDRQTSPSKEMEHHMKRLLLAFITLAAATALTAPAFAGLKDAKNKAECEKAGGVWVEKDNKCGVKKE